MAEKDTNQKPKDEEEDGLDDLLDSALKDFDKIEKKSGDGKKDKAKSTDAVSKSNDTDPPLADLPSEWNEEFMKIQAKAFEEKMAALFGAGGGGESPDPEVIQQGFQRMAEAASMALNPETENISDPNFTQSITEALRGLSEGAENLQTPFGPDEISDMFGNINLSDTSGNNPFLPFMQGMMQSLLSAEVLLPSLHDLVGKYPDWLAKNGDKIDAADRERYQKQMDLMNVVIVDLETEKVDDSAVVKQERFQRVFGNMQRMQDLGQPPADLVDLGPMGGLPAGFDPSQLGGLGGGAGAGQSPQCPTM